MSPNEPDDKKSDDKKPDDWMKAQLGIHTHRKLTKFLWTMRFVLVALAIITMVVVFK